MRTIGQMIFEENPDLLKEEPKSRETDNPSSRYFGIKKKENGTIDWNDIVDAWSKVKADKYV